MHLYWAQVELYYEQLVTAGEEEGIGGADDAVEVEQEITVESGEQGLAR